MNVSRMTKEAIFYRMHQLVRWEMFKYIFKGRLVKHGTIREAYIRCVIGEVQK